MSKHENPECETPSECSFQDVTRQRSKVIDQKTPASGVEKTVDKWEVKIRKCVTCGYVVPEKSIVEG